MKSLHVPPELPRFGKQIQLFLSFFLSFTFHQSDYKYGPVVAICIRTYYICSRATFYMSSFFSFPPLVDISEITLAKKKKLYPGRKRPLRFFIKRKPHRLTRVEKTSEPWPMPERAKPRGEHSERFFLTQQQEIRF